MGEMQDFVLKYNDAKIMYVGRTKCKCMNDRVFTNQIHVFRFFKINVTFCISLMMNVKCHAKSLVSFVFVKYAL